MTKLTRAETRILAMLVITLVGLLSVTSFLISEQRRLDALIDHYCQQRKVNAERTNAYYDRIADVVAQSTSVPEDFKRELVATYESAHVIVPKCKAT